MCYQTNFVRVKQWGMHIESSIFSSVFYCWGDTTKQAIPFIKADLFNVVLTAVSLSRGDDYTTFGIH